MPVYDFECPNGHREEKRFDSFRFAPKHVKCSICRCRSERQFPLECQVAPFEPYHSDAMEGEPYIWSRQQRDRELKKRGLRIKDKGE